MSRIADQAAALFVSVVSVALFGCATTSESAGQQQLTAHVGSYSPPPAGIVPPRLGVPKFEVTGSASSANLNQIAGDQLTTLIARSGRFDVIERAQLQQLVDEQNLEGVVKPEELAQKAQVRGVQYLMYGKVTNLRVKAEKASRNFGLGRLPIPGTGNTVGGFDFKKKSSTIKAECGVDLRIVDATSGSIFATGTKDYERTDSIGAFGVQVLGVNAGADADVQMSEDDKGLILRLAIDATLREMLSRIDIKLQQHHASGD